MAAIGLTRGYKIAIGSILGVGLIAVVIVAVVRFTDSSPAPGAYLDSDAERIVGFQIWRPSHLPLGVSAGETPVSVIPQARQIDLSYSAATQTLPLKGVSISEAPHGDLIAATKPGEGRPVSVGDAQGMITNSATLPNSYELTFSGDAIDFDLFGVGIGPNELLRVAESLRP